MNRWQHDSQIESQSDFEIRVMTESGLFDPNHYLDQVMILGDVSGSPLNHYLTSGRFTKASPSRYFDIEYLLGTNFIIDSHNSELDSFDLILEFLEGGWSNYLPTSQHFDPWKYWEIALKNTPNEDLNPLLHFLFDGYRRFSAPVVIEKNAVQYLNESELFDHQYYLSQLSEENQSTKRIDAVVHYLKSGLISKAWPNPTFNPQSFLFENPDVLIARLNPLAFYIKHRDRVLWNQFGKRISTYEELVTQVLASPKKEIIETPKDSQAAKASPRRIALFAGFDTEGIIRDCVVDYLKDLSNYATVYYLADCEMAESELDKLADYTEQAWAFRHGGYDFGSWSILNQLIGNQHIERYDEVVLANDSCFLLTSLSSMFSKMDSKSYQAWGAQATLRYHQAKDSLSEQTMHIPVDQLVNYLQMGNLDGNPVGDFHLSSYFLCINVEVFLDDNVQNLFNNVEKNLSKREIIERYELGLSKIFLESGFSVGAYIDDVLPFHPAYNEFFFEMLKQGFPLMKRNFFSYRPNRAQIDTLETISQILPGANISQVVSEFERNQIVTNRNLQIAPGMNEVITNEYLSVSHFRLADLKTPKYDDWWAFPVCAFTKNLDDNARAVFELVADDPSIKKIVFTRGEYSDITGVNVLILDLDTPIAQYYLMRCGVVFIKHAVLANTKHELTNQGRLIVQLWHGIPFKFIGANSFDQQHILEDLNLENASYGAVVCSSEIDKLAMRQAFRPLDEQRFWITGLPRHDIITTEESLLPSYYQLQILKLHSLLAGSRLVLWAPTFRNDDHLDFDIDPNDLVRLKDLLLERNLVLGIRPHLNDKSMIFSQLVDGYRILSVDNASFPEIEVLYRESICLITDFSSAFIDYLLTNKPMLGYSQDQSNYLLAERGSYYQYEEVFPGKLTNRFEDLVNFINELDSGIDLLDTNKHKSAMKTFYKFAPGLNASRLVELVKKSVLSKI